jgi:hypothetical protein
LPFVAEQQQSNIARIGLVEVCRGLVTGAVGTKKLVVEGLVPPLFREHPVTAALRQR